MSYNTRQFLVVGECEKGYVYADSHAEAAATDTENMKGELCQTPVIRREDLDTNYNTEEEYQAFERVHYSPKSGHFSDVVYVTTANN